MKILQKIGLISMVLVLLFSGCSNQKQENNLEVTPESATPIIENMKYPPMPVDSVATTQDKYRTYYEVFLYSFCDSNGDGIGDINGLISKLDYLNDNDCNTDTDLGITGIWLMPIMPSKSYHKYDVKDYFDIDSDYGTLEEFKTLIEECHKRDINVIIDFVFNHTSNLHPWFQEASTYLRTLSNDEQPKGSECKYIEYYNFSKDKAMNDSFYQVDGTDWYYEAQFSSDMPDLNLSCDAVRLEIEAIASFWLELGVDGYRLDAAKEYFTGSQTKNIEVLNWFSSYVYGIKPEAYLVAEVWDSFGTIASYYQSGIDSIFNYAFGNSDGKLASTANNAGNGKVGINLANNMKQVQDTFVSKNPNAIDASFLSNHDNNRVSSYVSYDEQLVKLLGGINLMMNGNSFIYYGEEIGMAGTGKDENKRAPMFWSKQDLTGMTSGPVNMEKQTQRFPAVDEQSLDESSIINYYRRAIRLKNLNPEISRGTIEVIDVSDGDITAVKKSLEKTSVILLINISAQEKQVLLNQDMNAYKGTLQALTTTAKQPVLEDNMIVLPPYAIVILREDNIPVK